MKIRKSTGQRTLEATGRDVIFEVFKEHDALPKMEEAVQDENESGGGTSLDIDDLD